jgi:ABC-type transporter Mla MlaB component
VTPSPVESKSLLQLPADCSIASIRTVYELIRQAFGRPEPLKIDCSNVDKADVTSIQLLLSTAKTGQAQGRPVILTAFSQTLRSALRRAGFSTDAMIDQHFPQGKEGV